MQLLFIAKEQTLRVECQNNETVILFKESYMSKLIYLLIFIILSLLNKEAAALWAAPQEVDWEKNSNGQFEIKIENFESRATIYEAGKRDFPMWQVKLPEFDGICSKLHLSDSGKTLYHVRGNHLVDEINETAVYAYHQDGVAYRMEARYFIDELIIVSRTDSTDPSYMWMSTLICISDEGLHILNANGREVEVLLADVETHRFSAKLPSEFPYMLPGYCFAGSLIEDKKALGGFGASDNLPKDASQLIDSSRKEIYLEALPEVKSTFLNRYNGMKLSLFNGTDKVQVFDASDSRIDIIQEALNEQGMWQPIEYLPASGCGNSFHQIFLGRGEYWEFDVPRYEGQFSTQLRFTLTLDNGKVIHSNKFYGSINPKQFTEKGYVGFRP